MKKLKFSFPSTLKKIDLCQPHSIERKIGDINQHENISWPKPHVHKTYCRRYINKREHNYELPGQSLEQNEELLVQYLEHHEESPIQSLDFIAINVFHATTILKEIHGHVYGGNWKEVTNSEMEQTTIEFSIPQEIVDRIP